MGDESGGCSGRRRGARREKMMVEEICNDWHSRGERRGRRISIVGAENNHNGHCR